MANGKILFFGKIADLAGSGEWQMPDFDGSLDEAGFVDLIAAGKPHLADALRQKATRVCVNRDLHPVSSAISITDADEVAYLSPMSGG